MTPAIIEHRSPNHGPRRKGVRVDTIVIHHTGTHDEHTAQGPRSAEDIDLGWLCNPEAGASAHYLIGRDGRIWRLVPEDRRAWHAGESHMPWEPYVKGKSVNDRSIGIELVNPGDGKTPFTAQQYEALAWLVKDIVGRLGWHVACFANGAPDLFDMPRVAFNERPHGGVGYILGHRDVAPGRKFDPADNFDWGKVRAALAYPRVA